MIRERLKEMELKITELADYLQVSRPTMYKFIDAYDNGRKEEVSKPALRVFEFIESDDMVGKKNVISFILNNLAEIDDTDSGEVNEIVNAVKLYVSANQKSEKTQFIRRSISSTQFDIIIHYLMDIESLFNKDKLTEEEAKKLIPYKEIIKIYSATDKEEK